MSTIGPTLEQLNELVESMKRSGTWLAVDGRFKVPSVDDLLKIHERGKNPQPWQDISTAPKDGTAILVGWEHDQWNDGETSWEQAIVRWGRPYNPEIKFDRCLVQTGPHAISSHVDGEPSHWRHLPEAPEKPTVEP